MAKKQYIGISGVARQVKKQYIGVSGVARKVKKGYVGVSGVARPFMASFSWAFNQSETVSQHGGSVTYTVTEVPIWIQVTKTASWQSGMAWVALDLQGVSEGDQVYVDFYARRTDERNGYADIGFQAIGTGGVTDLFSQGMRGNSNISTDETFTMPAGTTALRAWLNVQERGTGKGTFLFRIDELRVNEEKIV